MVAQISNQVVQPHHQYRHLNPSLLPTNRLLPKILTNIGCSPCTSSSSSSSCSSSPATTHTSTDSWSLNPQIIASKPDPPPARRKKASRACGHCQKAHLTCDDGRPCLRCIKRGLTKTCADGVRKKAKYLSDYDDALLVRPRPAVKRASEDILPFDNCKKTKTGSSDQDAPLGISWVELDVPISQFSNMHTQVLADEILGGNPFEQVGSLGGLDEWLAGFESTQSTRNDPTIHDLMKVEANVNQTSKPNKTRQKIHNWVERVERLVEIRKLTMNITADDEWMLKRNLDRSLMELDRIMALSGTPTMVWNTSGEILKVGDEFCMLTEWRREELIGRHVEDIFDPESLEEYLDLLEASVFPDHNFNHGQVAHSSQKSLCQSSQQRSSSSSSFSLSVPTSPSLSSKKLMAQANTSNSTLDSSCMQPLDASTAATANNLGEKRNKEREITQNIKAFVVRKACGKESISCSFCFKVGRDLFDCPSTVIANFLPILTRTSFSKTSS